MPARTSLQRLFLCALMLAAALPLFAAECPDLDGQPRFLGQAKGPGHVAATAVGSDQVAAITQDMVLVVYRLKVDAPPVPVDAVPLPCDHHAIAALDDHVFLAGELGVKIYRIGPDGDIAFRGRLAGFEPATDVGADGNRLAVLHETAWSLWDASDRTTPVRRARLDVAEYTRHVAVGGDRAVVGGRSTIVYDIGEPTAPVVLGSITDYRNLAGCVIRGNRLYELRNYTDGGGSWIYGDRWFLRTYDVVVRDLDDTPAFTILASHGLGRDTSIWGPDEVITASGPYVLAGHTNDREVVVIDTAAPAADPVLRIPVRPAVALAWQRDQLVGLAQGAWSWQVPATTDPTAVPVAAAGVGWSAYGSGLRITALDVAVAGELVAVLEWSSWWDTRYYEDSGSVMLYQPASGSLVPVSMIPCWSGNLALLDGLLLHGSYNVEAVDISDPAAPGEGFAVPLIPSVIDFVALDGHTIAVGNRDGLFAVFDLSDPHVPVMLGSCEVGENTGVMARDGDLVLVEVPSLDVVKVVDVSDRTRPKVRSVVKVPGRVTDLAGRLGQGLALTADGSEWMQVDFAYGVPTSLPTSDPDALALPESGRVTPRPLWVEGLGYHGEDLWLAGGGLHVYDQTSRSYKGAAATTAPVLGVASCQDQLYAVCHGELVDLGDFFSCDLQLHGVAATAVPVPRMDLTAAPNPFNPLTRVAFTLARAQPVELAVYDLKGRRVRDLARGTWSADRHVVAWNGRDDRGRELASGIYFVKLAAGPESMVTKVTLVR